MFYICVDKYRYKIFTCPNNGHFDNGICHGIEPDKDICLKQKCLNGGTCVHLHNHLYECLCPQNYFGNICQYTLDSCTRNVCGADSFCKSVFIDKYPFDYVCLYENGRKYGHNYATGIPFENTSNYLKKFISRTKSLSNGW
jgi:hypothetical protein